MNDVPCLCACKHGYIHVHELPAVECFDFGKQGDWPSWVRRFEQFREASGLKEKEEEVQVSALIYMMEDMAEDILRSFGLKDEDKKKYKVVRDRYEAYFVKKRNVIYERAKCNLRKQEDGEPVDDFVTSLYSLAQYCNFGDLHDEMIRDRLVVGLRMQTFLKRCSWIQSLLWRRPLPWHASLKV